MIKKCIAGRTSLDELKPVIENNQILFPVAAKPEYIKEDGRSFGYPVDEGWVTEITYDYTAGALTDDTIAIFEAIKEIKPKNPGSGTFAIEPFEFTKEQTNKWREGLSTNWAYDWYEDSLEKGLVDDGETKEQYVSDLLNCYHSWPPEWRKAYDNALHDLNSPASETEVVLQNEELTLYSDSSGDYFFKTSYYNYGALTKACKHSAESYIAKFEAYQEALQHKVLLLRKAKQNLETLRATI